MLVRSVSDGSVWFAALTQVTFLAVNRAVFFCPTHCLCSVNGIRAQAGKAIADALSGKTSLTHLNLSGMCAGLVCGGQTLWM